MMETQLHWRRLRKEPDDKEVEVTVWKMSSGDPCIQLALGGEEVVFFLDQERAKQLVEKIYEKYAEQYLEQAKNPPQGHEENKSVPVPSEESGVSPDRG